jgi:hypothetical protein
MVLASAVSIASVANAAGYSGTVSMLEIWPNGNIAFSIVGVALPCNGQSIINKSVPAAKNMYAALVAAKSAGRRITLSTSSCGLAEDYSPNVFCNIVDYLYVLD